MLKTVLRRAADVAGPSFVSAYREMRDKRFASSSPLLVTPFGFSLAGSKEQASGAFEDHEIATFINYLEHADVCIDVGANIGLYSCLAASHGKGVVAVEPLVANLTLLYRNLLANKLTAEVFPVAVGEKPELKILYGGGTGASFVEHWAHTPSSWNRVVPVTTLNTLVGTRFSCKQLLIKIDVEGFEYSVLQGASSVLVLNPRPVWVIEICLDEHFPGQLNPNFLPTFDLFWKAGYEAHIVDDTHRIVTREDVVRWIEQGHVDFGTHNYLFAAKS